MNYIIGVAPGIGFCGGRGVGRENGTCYGLLNIVNWFYFLNLKVKMYWFVTLKVTYHLCPYCMFYCNTCDFLQASAFYMILYLKKLYFSLCSHPPLQHSAPLTDVCTQLLTWGPDTSRDLRSNVKDWPCKDVHSQNVI